MSEIAQHWDKLLFLGSIFLFFIIWRTETVRAAEKQEERDRALLQAVGDVALLVKEARLQAAQEHGDLSKVFERLDAHTVEEHRNIEKALTQLTVSLEHLIADQRQRNISR